MSKKFEFLVCKADGARAKLIKCPNDDEPIIVEMNHSIYINLSKLINLSSFTIRPSPSRSCCIKFVP